MKIIEDGNERRYFRCDKCGCKFIAERNEYVGDRSMAVSHCPCCGCGVISRLPNAIYPTWYRWISDINGGAVVDHAFLLQPIPADIAEKLGVKPLK